MSKTSFQNIQLPTKYIPKKSEPYMCPEHMAYFYQLLTNQKNELINEAHSALNAVRTAEKNETAGVGDESDNASFEQELTMNLHMSDRDTKLLAKINAALERLNNGTFGYSLISGEEIGISRLLARPLATLTTEEQEEQEQKEI